MGTVCREPIRLNQLNPAIWLRQRHKYLSCSGQAIQLLGTLSLSIMDAGNLGPLHLGLKELWMEEGLFYQSWEDEVNVSQVINTRKTC